MKKNTAYRSYALGNAKRQKGNYLLNIGIGIMITAILAVWGIPKINDYLVEGAVPSVAEDIQRFISRVRVNTAGTGSTPYTSMNQTYFAQAVRGGTLQVESGGTVAGQGTGGTTVRHGLGGGTAGTVVLTVASNNLVLTFNSVDNAACPGLATALQRTFDKITINAKTAKDTDTTNKTVTTGYVAGTASGFCTDGDTNTFAFTIYP